MNDTIANISKTSPETAVSKPIAIYGGPLFDGKGSVFEDGAVFVSKGRFIYNNHTFLTLGEEIIIGEIQKASRRLWEIFIKN